MKEILPTFGRLAVLGNVGYSAAALEMREISEAAFRLGIEVIRLEIRNPDDIAAALEMAKGRADALYISTDPVVNTNRVRIHDLAMGAKLPAMSGVREYAAAGGVMSYGPSYPDLFRRAADLVDKILRGTKPGDIPIEQPTKFELVFNLKTAKALGITVPPRLLFTADEVIE
jgi:putative ABC transport system substrate-binding protein